MNSLHVFDPAALVWTDLSANQTGAIPEPRDSMGATVVEGHLLIFGGSNADGGT